MNSALLRAGLFVHTEMGMATDDQLFNSKLMRAVAGHDFSGSELVNYYRNPITTETLPEHTQLKSIEIEFQENLMQTIIDQNDSNFIFFAIINTKHFKANLSHELLHAQYYDTPKIAEILHQVWQKVPATDQQIIIDCLRTGGYDVKQQELLLREFYSYFLQADAKNYLATIKALAPMSPLAKTYASKIQTALKKAGISVLTLD